MYYPERNYIGAPVNPQLPVHAECPQPCSRAFSLGGEPFQLNVTSWHNSTRSQCIYTDIAIAVYIYIHINSYLHTCMNARMHAYIDT